MARGAFGVDSVQRMMHFTRRALFAILTLIALGAVAASAPQWVAYVARLQYSGIGITLDQAPRQRMVSDVVAGTPAARAGLRIGDEILTVNDEDVSALTRSEVSDRVRGPEGTYVNLVILRGTNELAFSLVREQLDTPNRGAAALGISVPLAGGIIVAFSVFGAAATLAVALFLFLRRAAGPFVSLVALAGLYGGTGAAIRPVLGFPDWGWLAIVVFAISSVLAMAVLCRFPDGRFVPRATAVALLLLVGVELVWVAGFVATGSREKPDLVRIGELALLASGVVAQVYRYRRVSTPTQRQQTKWFILGASILLIAASTELVPLAVPEAFVSGTPEHLAYALLSLPALALGTAAAALAVAFGVLKYRLFDIDLIIDRALVYGSVTAILAGSFAGLSAVAQWVLRSMTGQHSEIVSIALAVLVAAAFAPLKTRVQRIVDRHMKVAPTAQLTRRAATQ